MTRAVASTHQPLADVRQQLEVPAAEFRLSSAPSWCPSRSLSQQLGHRAYRPPDRLAVCERETLGSLLTREHIARIVDVYRERACSEGGAARVRRKQGIKLRNAAPFGQEMYNQKGNYRPSLIARLLNVTARLGGSSLGLSKYKTPFALP